MITSLRACSLGLALVGLSCGSNPVAPSVVQIAGTWTGTATYSRLSGGECVGEFFDQSMLIGTTGPITVTFTQSGKDVQWMRPLGLCAYTGTADSSTYTLTTTASCRSNDFRGFPCSGGRFRDVVLADSVLSGSVNGNTSVFTIVQNDNVFLAGTTTLVGVRMITVTGTMNRQ